MGTWGTGIFDNDVATDVAKAFEYKLQQGADVISATEHILAMFVPDEDIVDGPIVYLVLASLQLQHSALQPSIQGRALQIIASGEDLERWQVGGLCNPDYLERKQILEDLRLKLISS